MVACRPQDVIDRKCKKNNFLPFITASVMLASIGSSHFTITSNNNSDCHAIVIHNFFTFSSVKSVLHSDLINRNAKFICLIIKMSELVFRHGM